MLPNEVRTYSGTAESFPTKSGRNPEQRKASQRSQEVLRNSGKLPNEVRTYSGKAESFPTKSGRNSDERKASQRSQDAIRMSGISQDVFKKLLEIVEPLKAQNLDEGL